ncbi:hypothetical protein FS837_007395 [Tulasnella sp. UAMH 9824]|nr:hypothetical protein FS837_007395 [Tulasnella sp. UAMH 9824]
MSTQSWGPHNEELWIATRSLRHLKRLSLDFKVACDSRMLGSPKDTIAALDDVTSGIFPKLEAFSAVLPSSDFSLEHRRLEIFNAPIMPYASEMWHVGQSLPQLETLRIDIRPPTEQGIAGSGSSLISILQVFPQINYLETGIVCDSIPDTAQTKPHTSLEVLDLSWSPAPKARLEEIARFLRSILPRKTRVIHVEERELFGLNIGEAAWGEVARLVDEAA